MQETISVIETRTHDRIKNGPMLHIKWPRMLSHRKATESVSQ